MREMVDPYQMGAEEVKFLSKITGILEEAAPGMKNITFYSRFDMFSIMSNPFAPHYADILVRVCDSTCMVLNFEMDCGSKQNYKNAAASILGEFTEYFKISSFVLENMNNDSLNEVLEEIGFVKQKKENIYERGQNYVSE